MATFKLEIAIGNDGMKDVEHLAMALKEVAERLLRTQYALDKLVVRGIMDENGNAVGSWEIDPTLEIPV